MCAGRQGGLDGQISDSEIKKGKKATVTFAAWGEVPSRMAMRITN